MKYKCYFFMILSISSFAKNTITNSYITLDTMQAFWRNQPVIGRWLSEGQGLISIPHYMKNGSFPYLKRNFSKEVPFADSLNIVRLLGGWDYNKQRGELNGQKEADLVYIENGKMKYRWSLLKKRLDPYILLGYTDLTLVLDNIPWDLPKKPKLNVMGQVNPPYRMGKWSIFIESMMKELVHLYGHEIVRRFRFRLGTENQHKERFNGTYEEYIELYENTQKAIHKVLPKAQLAPFNFGGGKGQMHNTNIDMQKFMLLARSESNISKLSVDFLPVSTYYVVRKKHKKNMKKLLDARFEANKKYFKILFDASKKTFPKEVHEFGILNRSVKYVKSDEPGARGAAWRMYMIQNMMENNITRLYHWGSFDRVAKGKYLLKGNGWNYSILDHLVGGEAYSLPTITSADNSFHYKTLIVKKNKKMYLLTTVFPDRKDDWSEKNIRISVPSELMENNMPKIKKWAYLTKKTSVMDVIHDELLSNNMLDTAFLADINVVGRANSMGSKYGKQYIRKYWKHYEAVIVDSLTLKPFTGTVSKDKNMVSIDMNISIPSVNIIVLSF